MKQSYFEDSEYVEKAKNSDPRRDWDFFYPRLCSWVMCFMSPNEPRRSTCGGVLEHFKAHVQGHIRQALHYLPAANASGRRSHIALSLLCRMVANAAGVTKEAQQLLGVNRWEQKSMLYADAKSHRGRPNRAKLAFGSCRSV